MLLQIAHDAAAIKDARAAAGACFELGDLGLDAYEQVRALVEQYVNLKYIAKPEPGTEPSELNTMKCIDLFHSKALDHLTRLLVAGKAK